MRTDEPDVRLRVSDRQANRVIAAGEKHAKLHGNGSLPANASPAAVPTMFTSAMPISKKRSGNFLAEELHFVDLERSASRTTISWCIHRAWRALHRTPACRFAAITFSPFIVSRSSLARPASAVGRHAVPADRVLHEGDALALDRASDGERRFPSPLVSRNLSHARRSHRSRAR